MKADIYMTFYIGDYLKDTMHLNTEQHGAYFLLICAYWMRRGPIPDDDETLLAITRLNPQSLARSKAILARFFEVRDGHWHHKRIEAELAKALTIKQVNSSRGKRAAVKRWNAPSIPGAMLQASETDAPSNARSNTLHTSYVNKDKASISSAENEVELPKGFPTTEAEAVMAAEFIPCPHDFAVKTWNKAMSRCGRDAKDIPIRNWRHYLANEFAYERDRVEREKSRPNATHPPQRVNRNVGTLNEQITDEERAAIRAKVR